MSLSAAFGFVLELLVIAAVIGVAAYVQRRHRVVQYAIFLRFPLLYALFLLFLPLAKDSRAFRTLFVLDAPELATVAILVVFSTWTVMYTMALVFIGAAPRFSLRFDEPDQVAPEEKKTWDLNPPANMLPGWMHEGRLYLAPILLGLPLIAVSFTRSTPESLSKIVAVAAGIVLAVGSRWLAVRAGRRIRQWVFTPQPSVPASQYIKLPQRIRLAAYRFADSTVGQALTRPFSRGYSRLEDGESEASAREGDASFSHTTALWFFALTLVIYAAGAILLEPTRTNPLVAHTPALAYVLLVAMLFGLLLPAVSFFFDFYRVPLLAILIALLMVSYRYSDLDHYYRFSTDAVAAGRLPAGDLAPLDVVSHWNARHPVDTHPVMVVFAVSGGGGHAARWTTEVLKRLRDDERLASRFFQSTAVMSLVSGGGLGAMYAIDEYEPDAVPSPEELVRARDAASHSAAAALAWGFTYPDLVRKIVPALFDEERDRGWALEQAWRARLRDPRKVPTLASWTDDARHGWRPAVIFNATAMESGKRFLISRVHIPGTAAEEFATLYPDRDLSVVTAVRLSAAFPYLSPMARPLTPYKPGDQAFGEFERHSFHLADGGYYDGFGVLTAIEFLENVLPQFRNTFKRSRVLLVQIRTALDENEPAAAGNKGWINSFDGPLATSLAVSRSSQAARAELEVKLLKDRWNSADLPEANRIDIESVVFRLRDTGTLPWHLSEDEKLTITNSWDLGENQIALDHLEKFFDAPQGRVMSER